jgi:hypothetical protein
MGDVILFAQGLSQELYASAARGVEAVVCPLVKLFFRIWPAVGRNKRTDVLQQACLRLRLLDVLAYHCELFVQRVVLWRSAPSRHSAERLAGKARRENIRPAVPHLIRGTAVLEHVGSVCVKVLGLKRISFDESPSSVLLFCPDDILHLNASHSEKHTEAVHACVHGVHDERLPQIQRQRVPQALHDRKQQVHPTTGGPLRVTRLLLLPAGHRSRQHASGPR